jgi:replicative DNA helicase
MNNELFVYGKTWPHASDLEESVLGSIMWEQQRLDEVLEVIRKPIVFYNLQNQNIFAAILSLHDKRRPFDFLSVIEELRRKELLDVVGGPYYVTKLTNNVVSSASTLHHSRIIFQKFVQRKIIEVGGVMVQEGFEDSTDPFELLNKLEEAVYKISNTLQRRDFTSIDTALVQSIQEIEEKRHNQERVFGVPTGFPPIDRLTNGWQDTDLIILAARPSVGKTALALNLARNAALDPFKPVPVAFFSLEMSSRQLINRLLSAESEIPIEKIQKGRMEDDDMRRLHQKGIQKLAQAPIFIDDTAALNIFELRSKCRRLKNTNNIGLIIIDYLQLMSGTSESGNREQVISNISRSLKALAKELGVPIIALSQLSRETEKRTGNNKMPQLSDLRESGALEQDADVVIFLYRPEYYNIHHDATGETNVGETHVRFAKHRSGALDLFKLRADLVIQKFYEFTETKSPIYRGTGLDFKKLSSGEKNGASIGSQLNAIDDDPF